MVEQNQELVTITGVTGYLGSTILRLFIKQGTYKIRATMRNAQDIEK